ncbi:MAG: diguanylate cyclase [Calditrichaeota bacterium]|jgi:diguanylate cyclase (GGDEF)-like protein|nr:diguanylate cyclase [Calditrichota bacterium]MBT5426137.1 diguanylate cyclase [Bacteroidota bacterium]MBT7787384.1 diguanylate cyclase [Calditrichota bacterium]
MNTKFNKNPKIIFVDDDKSIRDDFRKFLSGDSKISRSADKSSADNVNLPRYDLDTALDWEIALKKIEAAVKTGNPYTVCFVNVLLFSGLGGKKTIKRIIEVDDQLQIVVCSTYADHTWEDMFFELGESHNLAFLRIPFDAIELPQMLLTLTRKWNLSATTRMDIDKLQKAVQDKTSELERVLSDLEIRKAAEMEAKKERETAFHKLEKSLHQLQQLVTTDALTGLSNRRSFDEKLDEYAHLSERLKQPLSCIMADIDHFKRFNDDYGHQTGDEVLRQIAKTLDNNIRKTDLIARYGGEEFVLLLPNTIQERAFEVADKLRQAIQDAEVLSAGITHRVTVSMGVFGRTVKASEMLDLVSNADKALYMSKDGGRNRVTCFVED